MRTITNSSDSKLLSLYFFRLREPPYWMSFPVEVDTKLREGSMSSRVFICEQSTRIICTRHTPSVVVELKFSNRTLKVEIWRKLRMHLIQ